MQQPTAIWAYIVILLLLSISLLGSFWGETPCFQCESPGEDADGGPRVPTFYVEA